MRPYYADDWLTVYLGDCRAVLAELPADSVHCVITSPPYYGLRDYGTASWEGGDEGCDHAGPPKASDTSGLNHGRGRSDYENGATVPFRHVCRKCGARRIDSQIGLEPTPEQYVAELVAVFREVRRVLRPDGTVWLNLGDSYAGAPAGSTGGQNGYNDGRANRNERRSPPSGGLKPKDRMMIPARVALALQADGWWLRDEIVWAKPNPMPSSVTDRTTPAHEMVYLLTKRARYWYDADAVREPSAYPPGSGWDDVPRGGFHGKHDADDSQTDGAFRAIRSARNKRSVWAIATQPYPEAHFATFPEALVEPMVLAGCPEGGTVLDPFAGSGTVGLVAQRHSRRAILVDLSAEYMRQLMERNQQRVIGL